MFFRPVKSVTLIELLIAIILLAVIVLGVNSMNVFSNYHILSSDKRAKLQNDLSYVLEHMAKNISRAIGNESIEAGSVVKISNNPNNKTIAVYIDASGNGQREAPINNPAPGEDHWIAYRYDVTGNDKYRISYCGICRDKEGNCNQCTGDWEILSRKIADLNSGILEVGKSYLEISVDACWDPAGDCGAPDNPWFAMSTSISLPSVATN